MNLSQGRADHRLDINKLPEIDGLPPELEGVDWSSKSDPFGMFSSRGMEAPPVLTLGEVQRKAQPYSSRILSNHRLLYAILGRHEATIKKRWEKKKSSQRLAILRDAWGTELPATHRPDFSVWRRNENQVAWAGKAHRGAFLMPYINEEDMVKPRALPLLLNARGRNHPSCFAAADGEAMHLGKISMAVVPIFLNLHVSLLNGITEDRDYGRTMSWDEHPDAFEWMHRRSQFLPGEALLILEAQDRLMSFLVACCQAIMHDIPKAELTSAQYPIEPQPELKTGIDAGTGMMSLAILAEEAPYRPPAEIDFERIHSLLAARTSRAEDYVWALREDPTFFAEELLELKEHRQEMIKDTRGSPHPALCPPRENVLWARLIGNLHTGAVTQLEMYTELRNQAMNLRKLQKKYAKELSHKRPLPEMYLDAVLKFRHYIQQMCKGPMGLLKMAFPASPPMRNRFARDVPTSPDSSKIIVSAKSTWKPNKIEAQVLWLMQTLWEDGQNLFLAGLPFVVDELDRLLKSEPEVAGMISSYVAMVIGELSILAECLRQIEIYQPWANMFTSFLVDKEEDIKTEYAHCFQNLAHVMNATQEKNVMAIARLADPSDNKFDYPAHRKRNKANVDKMREAEASLDTFWANLDLCLSNKRVNLDGTALKKLLTQPRALQRTPEWVEPPVANKGGQTKKKDSEPTAAMVELYKPLSNLFLGETAETKATSSKMAKSQKVKTRGTPGSMEGEDQTTAPSASAQPDDQPLFRVDARALKVFRVVFFDPTANTTPGEVAWNDFLHAMVATGFAAQKLYGSVWHFQPTTLDVERSIQFHEPHPKGKIPFVVARRYGRRLSRAYGWFGGMFKSNA